MHRIRVEIEGRTTVVHAEGELDAYAAPDLEAAFEAVSLGSSVLADFTRVSFLDSTALGLLVRAVRQFGDDGESVRVVLPTTPARRIFEITALDAALPVSASRRDALNELSLPTPP